LTAVLLAAASVGVRAQDGVPAWFERFDRNDDGRLTADELPPKQQPVLRQFDANGDDVVTREEARAVAARQNREAKVRRRELPAPAFSNVCYGTGDHAALDLWRPPGPPTVSALVICFRTPPADAVARPGAGLDTDLLTALLDRGIAVAAVNAPVADPPSWETATPAAARAVQFIRHHAITYGVDPARIGGVGFHTAGLLALRLAVRDDAVLPTSSDPHARQSSRLQAVVAVNPVDRLEPRGRWLDSQPVGARQAAAWEEELGAQLSADDPPILLDSRGPGRPDRALTRRPPSPRARSRLAIILGDAAHALGLDARVAVVAADDPEPPTPYLQFLVEALRASSPRETAPAAEVPPPGTTD